MHKTLRHALYEIMEPGVGKSIVSFIFHRTCIAMILVSVIFAVLLTIPTLSATSRYELLAAEYALGAFFLIEYLLRLWTASEHLLYARANSWRSALAYSATPLMLMDLVGIVPFVLQILSPGSTEAILLLQVSRFFRLSRYSPAIDMMGRVLVAEWRALRATAVIGLGMLLVSATAMYLLENAAQPKHFGSIPDAMYWAIVTLATVGYGDVVPITAAGKFAASLVIVGGLIFFALPIAIVATSFVGEIRRRDFIVNFSMVARVPLFSSLDAAAISELTGMLRAHKIPEGSVIVRRGDSGESMFFIAHGQVEAIVPDGSFLLHAGEFFGEIAVLGKTRRTATVIAREACELLVLDAADLLKVMEKNPQMEAALRNVAAARQGALDNSSG
jgi:voltage-gated potassium channel